MSVVSRIIGTAERVPLPDVLIRAGIQQLCSRTATRLASGDAATDAAFAGEALADSQLKSFRMNPANKGKVCDIGLWRWSRHPNYFFEWFGWVSYPVIALSFDYPWGFATLLAPLFMFWILRYVTGVPPLEEQMLKSRGDAYRAYQAQTSVFFPLPPKEATS